jgi:hypothetical protein
MFFPVVGDSVKIYPDMREEKKSLPGGIVVDILEEVGRGKIWRWEWGIGF